MIVQLSGISKYYRSLEVKTWILKDITFSIESGGYVCIVGKSGSGKSTLLNILGCLDQANSGKYLLNGKMISEASDDELSELRSSVVGFVFQSFQLLPSFTVMENILLPLQYSKKSINNSMEVATELINKLDIGFLVDRYPPTLSGGQRQRVAIARALINRPKLILADEPTGNLDSKTKAQVMELFGRLHSDFKVTVVMVTHDIDTAQDAPRILRLQDGMIYND